ncbi:MAG: tetratricopeptide repeat protein, partial [Candidatus Helarchaeota archaeon]|nr:tetratricopeptide repeat protein [Candidatus Helarchaeota archaeon]
MSTDNEDEWIKTGLVLLKQGEYEESLKCFEEAIKLNPHSLEAWCNKSLALLYLRKYEESQKCYNPILEIDPDNADAWVQKGVFFESVRSF